jgi:two-component system sensor kinase FixL
VSAALVAAGYVGLVIAAGLLPMADFTAAALRYWVGDMIGIMVITPFALVLWTRRQVLRMSSETLLQFAAILAALTLVFGYASAPKLRLFYVLFLPIVWMAVRTGIEGVSIGILTIQLGLIAGMQLFPDGTHDLTAIHALMLVLALTGLFAGELVTERRRTEAELRLHQESVARLARLGSVGELVANPFLPFLSTNKEGLGFGLPLCRSLIEAHDGRIWLDVNSPGAAIHFTLPVAKLSVTTPSHG